VNAAKTLARYCSIARPILLDFMPPNSCIGATRVTCDVLEALGFHVVPFATKLVVEVPSLNVAYTSGLSDEELARSKGQVRTPWGQGWRGHLVAHVEGRLLLDSSFDQVNDGLRGRLRLRRKIVHFPLQDVSIERGFRAEYGGLADDGTELKITYATTRDESWRDAPAWNDEGLPFLVAALLGRMKR